MNNRNLTSEMEKLGFTHRDEGLIQGINKYRGVFVRSDGVEFIHDVDAGEVQSNVFELRYLSACRFFDSIKSVEDGVTEEEFRNKQILPAAMQREIDLKNNPPLCVDRETLRDRFAMAALTAIVSQDDDVPNGYAKSAYEIANAMLEARGKK